MIDGKAVYKGNTKDISCLQKFRDKSRYTYWYPEDNNFPHIDCIANGMDPETTHKLIAYIQI